MTCLSQKYVFRLFALIILVLPASNVLAQSTSPATETYAVTAQTGVRVRMRDGVSLTADVYRPKVDGKFPVLMTRTPYNRKDAATGIFLASHGYVVIQQDTRGRFESGGEFYPFKHEMNDGYDSIEWAASLPYSDGRVGMYGGSYVGATQMLAAASSPPHLVAIFPYITAAEYYEGWTYEGGALMQWFASSWTSGLVLDTLQRKTSALTRSQEWVSNLPIEDYRLFNLPTASEVAPYFRDWLEHQASDEYWRSIKISDHYSRMNIKALHAGGWHDIFSGGSIRNFIDMRKQAPSAEAKSGQRLLMGPWAHADTSPEGKIGDVTFGKQAVLDMNVTILNWYDYVMKGRKNEFATGAPVRIFVMGDNVWRDEKEFPLVGTKYTKYFLHSTRGSNSLNGDGMISTTAPKSDKPDTFEYDPASPVPTIGGRIGRAHV